MFKRVFKSKSPDKAPEQPEADWEQPFEVLRGKWHEVPFANERLTTKQLADLSDEELIQWWTTARQEATTGPAFSVRGWYHLLYKEILNDKKVMDVGSGLGLDGITFAQHGTHVTFVDIVESNVANLKRICGLLALDNVAFCYLENLDSLAALPVDYDAIWCQGSLINAPYETIRTEAQELLKHLPVGGRWIELAYPKVRWEREGRLPFERWGERTDGGAPWIEWYELDKMLARLAPAGFDVVLHFNFHNDDFNWFDLVRQQ